MAIDPRISLAANPNIQDTFRNALLNVQGAENLFERREQAPLRNQLLQAQVGTAEATQQQQEETNRFTSVAFGAAEILPDLQSNNIQGVQQKLTARRNLLLSQGRDTVETDNALSMLANNPQELLQKTNEVIGVAQQQGILKAPNQGGMASAKTEILADGSVVQALPNGEVQVRDPSGIIVTGQARLDALNTSRQAALSTRQDESNIKIEAEGKKVEAVAKAESKVATTVAKTRVLINTQVKLAEKAAIERGDVLTDLSRMQAALPGLTDVVGKLKELAPIATSTLGGKLFDMASKELGFGSTKGATAATKFGAMVNNQILPLLKPTFGGSFSVQEGQELKATMGDKDLSTDEKLATLEAFLEQKQRDIETKQLQLDGGGSDAGVIMVDGKGNRARVFKDGRVEEL
jgi:hypothetical protein